MEKLAVSTCVPKMFDCKVETFLLTNTASCYLLSDLCEVTRSCSKSGDTVQSGTLQMGMSGLSKTLKHACHRGTHKIPEDINEFIILTLKKKM